MPLPDIFHSLDAFRAVFADGLQRLLDDRGLGGYILALANASFDPALFIRLNSALRENFAYQCADLDSRQEDGRLEKLPPDDLAVFEQLRKIGLDRLESARFRQAGQWEVQFNPLRALRPPRTAGVASTRLGAPFDPMAFNFNRLFLRKESIWIGALGGRKVDLLYNKFPFVELHGLLVPERERGSAQYLSEDAHRFAWNLAETLNATLPGVGLAYNAYGAYASVNHLHFHLFARTHPLPVEQPEWMHNWGIREYPGLCRVFDEVSAAYVFIQSLHRADTPYNLLYRPGKLYCLARRFQGTYQPAEWSAGHAWYEMCGGVVTFSAEHFAMLSEAAIAGELRRLTPV
jgi:diadenosine tetraphosphate (Ap4A) HIT family hydrolase